MARRARKRVTSQAVIDATPERLAKGDDSAFINPAEIDSNQPIGLTRRFKSSHLDRLYRKDDDKSPLSWVQWYAGDWYRSEYHRGRFGTAIVSSYGERTTGGENSYGLPRTEAQLRARKNIMAARKQWPASMADFMDRLLIHDEFPKYGRRARIRTVAEIKGALDILATWLKIGV